MSYTLTVTNPVNHIVWKKPLADDEVTSVKEMAEKGKPITPFWAALYPVRTDYLDNFAEDFFIPTTLNTLTEKDDDLCHRIVEIIYALAFDIITFLIRLITALPRVIYNSQQKPLPFFRYLKQNHVDEKLLIGDRVLVKITTIAKKVYEHTEFPSYYTQVPHTIAPREGGYQFRIGGQS